MRDVDALLVVAHEAAPSGLSGITNLSPKTTANWVFASNHSRGGRFHSSAAWFSTRDSSFMAASSLGKCPRVRTARRSLEFSASMAFVTGMIMTAPSDPRWRCEISGVWCDHPGQGHREHAKCGQADIFDELRARVSSWPPLRPARLRRERGSVGVASPAGSRLFKERGSQ